MQNAVLIAAKSKLHFSIQKHKIINCKFVTWCLKTTSQSLKFITLIHLNKDKFVLSFLKLVGNGIEEEGSDINTTSK